MKKIGQLVVAATIFFALGAGAVASEIEALRTASDAAKVTIKRALSEGDSGLLTSVMADDITIVAPTGQTMRGMFTIRATAVMLFSFSENSEVSFERQTINLIDSLGYESGRYTVSEKLEGGKVRKIEGRYTLVWKSVEGEWKLYVVIGIR